MIKKFPKRALADLLRRIIPHVEKYDCTMSMEFDGKAYRVSVTGEGELLFDPNDDSSDKNNTDEAESD